MIRHLAFLAALALTLPAAAQTGTPRAVDGDTLAFGSARVRLHGIDAPEISQTCRDERGAEWHCGRAARAALARIVRSGETVCVRVDRDRYGRTVARCTVRGRDVSAEMVRDGMAEAYRRYSTAYVREESAARIARRGIWRGEHATPSDYRHQRKSK